MRRIATAACSLVMAVLVGSCDSPPSAAPIQQSIVGTVRELGTNAPIPDALVQTTPSTTSQQTSAQGTYEIKNVAAQSYVVQVTKPGYANGSTTIVVAPGKSATADVQLQKLVPVASVTVQPGATSLEVAAILAFTAIVRDGAGNVLTGRTISWSSTSPAVASVSTPTGASTSVTAVAPGVTTIRAICEGVTGTVEVAVVPPVTVATVAVTPLAQTIAVGGTVQLTATVLDAAGKPISGKAITWTSSASSVAFVSATGLVTGVASGSAQIQAKAGNVIGTAAITVTTGGSVTRLLVLPPALTLVVGQKARVEATKDGYFVYPTWSSANGTVVVPEATFNGDNEITAVAPGLADISATIDGLLASTHVSVIAGTEAIRGVTVLPAVRAIAAGTNLQLTATVVGNTGISTALTWATSDPTKATVNSDGLVTAITNTRGVSVCAVAVAAPSVMGCALLTVGTPAGDLVIQPAATTIRVGQTVTLAAWLNGYGTYPAWASMNSSVVTVERTYNANNTIRGVAPGMVVVVATKDGLMAATVVTVVP